MKLFIIKYNFHLNCLIYFFCQGLKMVLVSHFQDFNYELDIFIPFVADFI